MFDTDLIYRFGGLHGNYLDRATLDLTIVMSAILGEGEMENRRQKNSVGKSDVMCYTCKIHRYSLITYIFFLFKFLVNFFFASLNLKTLS